MKKRILILGILVMLIAMLVVLTGCGNKRITDTEEITEKENSITNNIKLNAGYRYTEEDGFGYNQIDLYDDGSVVSTAVETERGVVQQCYGKYTIEGNNLTIKLTEEYSFRSNKRVTYPDGDWYWTILSDNEIRSERIYDGVKGRNYKYVDTIEKIIDNEEQSKNTNENTTEDEKIQLKDFSLEYGQYEGVANSGEYTLTETCKIEKGKFTIGTEEFKYTIEDNSLVAKGADAIKLKVIGNNVFTDAQGVYKFIKAKEN